MPRSPRGLPLLLPLLFGFAPDHGDSPTGVVLLLDVHTELRTKVDPEVIKTVGRALAITGYTVKRPERDVFAATIKATKDPSCETKSCREMLVRVHHADWLVVPKWQLDDGRCELTVRLEKTGEVSRPSMAFGAAANACDEHGLLAAAQALERHIVATQAAPSLTAQERDSMAEKEQKLEGTIDALKRRHGIQPQTQREIAIEELQ